MNNDFKTVDKYIKSFPKGIQDILVKLRSIITENAPEAEEMIAYKMPAYKLNKRPLVYFAGFKDHISVFPTSSQVEEGVPEAAEYRSGKGTLQFSLDKPIPLDLIKKVIKFRVKQVEELTKK